MWEQTGARVDLFLFCHLRKPHHPLTTRCLFSVTLHGDWLQENVNFWTVSLQVTMTCVPNGLLWYCFSPPMYRNETYSREAFRCEKRGSQSVAVVIRSLWFNDNILEGGLPFLWQCGSWKRMNGITQHKVNQSVITMSECTTLTDTHRHTHICMISICSIWIRCHHLSVYYSQPYIDKTGRHQHQNIWRVKKSPLNELCELGCNFWSVCVCVCISVCVGTCLNGYIVGTHLLY